MQLLHSTFRVVESCIFTSQNSSKCAKHSHILKIFAIPQRFFSSVMNHIKTGYLPTWWVFDSRARKQDPCLAGIYAPLGPQIYASTRKGSKPCNPAASPVHVPRPQEGLHMKPYEGKTVSEEITPLFIVSFLVCCQQNIRCTDIKLEFEAINFIQFSGWSDNPCLQISTFGFPLSRSIYDGGITPMMISPVLWRTNYHIPASHNEHIILKQHWKQSFL